MVCYKEPSEKSSRKLFGKEQVLKKIPNPNQMPITVLPSHAAGFGTMNGTSAKLENMTRWFFVMS